MAEVSAAAVKALREQTGQPMMDCKAALTEAAGDMEAAVRILRESATRRCKRPGSVATPSSAGSVCTSIKPRTSARWSRCSARAPRSPAVPMSSNSRRTWLSNWPPALARPRPKSCSSNRRRARPSRPWRAKGRHVQSHPRGVQCRSHGANQRQVRRLRSRHGRSRFVGRVTTAATPRRPRDIAMHIVASAPSAVNKENLDQTEVEKERSFLTEQARAEGSRTTSSPR